MLTLEVFLTLNPSPRKHMMEWSASALPGNKRHKGSLLCTTILAPCFPLSRFIDHALGWEHVQWHQSLPTYAYECHRIELEGTSPHSGQSCLLLKDQPWPAGVTEAIKHGALWHGFWLLFRAEVHFFSLSCSTAGRDKLWCSLGQLGW